MEEVIGSIPIRSTKYPTSSHIFADICVARPLFSSRVSNGVKFPHLRRQHQFHDFYGSLRAFAVPPRGCKYISVVRQLG
jgi:hypothetical protein